MNWVLSAGCAAYVVLVMAVIAQVERAGSIGRGTVVAGFSIPPIFLALAIWGAHAPMDQLRVLVESVSLDNKALASGLTVGGGITAAEHPDDIVSDGLPPGLLTVQRNGGGVSVRAHQAAYADAGRSGVVSTGKPTNPRFVGALPLEPGDSICLERCDAGGRWLTVAPEGYGLIQANGTRLEAFPERKVLQVLQGLIFWGPDQRIYPLRDFGRPPAAALGNLADDDVCARRFLCVRGQAQDRPVPARTFIFHKGGMALAGGRSLWIVGLDPGFTLKSKSGEKRRFAPDVSVLTTSPDESATKVSEALSVWSVRYADTDPEVDPSVASRLVDRRDMGLVADSGGVSVFLRTAPLAVGNGIGDPVASAYRVVGNGSPATVANDDPALAFPSLGGRLAQRVGGRLSFSSVDRNSIGVTSEGGRATVTLNRSFPMGPGVDAETGSWQAHVRAERLSPPWFLLPAVALTAFVLAVGCGEVWMEAPLALLVIVALQFLLALRFVIGVEGAFLDTTLDWRTVLLDNAVNAVAIPVIFAATAFWARPKTSSTGPFGLAIFAAGAAICFAIDFGRGAPWKDLSPFAILITMLAIGLSVAVGLRGRFQSKPNPNRERQSAAAAAAPKWRPGWWLVLVSAFAFRIIIAVFGVKERFTFPQTLAVSAIYLPWLLAGFGMMFASLEDHSDRLATAVLAIVVTAAMFGAPAPMNDTGFAILALPVVFWIAGYDRRARSSLPPEGEGASGLRAARMPGWLVRAAWRAPAVALGAFLAASVAAPLVLRIQTPDEAFAAAAASDSDGPALKLIHKLAESSQLRLRYYTVANPHLVTSAGTTEAENLRVWSAYLDDYTSSFFGRGLMQPSRFGPLADVHLSDNVIAVHVMSPFGRAGAAGVIAMLAALALACQRVGAPAAAHRRTWREITGLLALWTLCAGGAYMVLANLQLVPFTGRNVYLLAAASRSDLVEGVTLLMLGYVGIAFAKRTT